MNREKSRLSVTIGQDNASSVLEKFIQETLSDEELNTRSFLGIGIAMPGLVDSYQWNDPVFCTAADQES